MVMISFILLALSWLSKKPGFFTGWLELMPYHDVSVNSLQTISLLSMILSLQTLPYRRLLKLLGDFSSLWLIGEAQWTHLVV